MFCIKTSKKCEELIGDTKKIVGKQLLDEVKIQQLKAFQDKVLNKRNVDRDLNAFLNED